MKELIGPWPCRARNTPVAVLSHRGRLGPPGHGRDNTLAAFAGAMAAGADGVELDVRATADGVPVVHHDPEVDGVGPLHLVRAADLPPWLPTLEAALAACAGAAVDVEVKNSPAEAGHDPGEGAARAGAEILAGCLGTPNGPARALVSAFWPGSLEAVQEACPELPTGLLAFPGAGAVEALERAAGLGCRALLPFGPGGPGLVEAAHRSRLAVVCWGVDSGADLAAAGAAGVDGVITDEPARALEVLGRR
ncbi:MAG: glycerophosphodiester phosphodiesterase [Acidobacteriota bacterium]|nr:glycerophosphodiester phosphodiesterase [Acidobacteriota bacterium]